MNLNENEKRMVYQLESTCQIAVLNEIAMTHRYTRNQTTKDTAESLLSKLRLLSDKECMDLVKDRIFDSSFFALVQETLYLSHFRLIFLSNLCLLYCVLCRTVL